ncbi:hypothetical protein DFS34DRAFT_599214 [Phlyctochytrium arcticum]|nr:hypothetical protein DFS34DRAFT_599214 [Phlyctochytrium arcticum]
MFRRLFGPLTAFGKLNGPAASGTKGVPVQTTAAKASWILRISQQSVLHRLFFPPSVQPVIAEVISKQSSVLKVLRHLFPSVTAAVTSGTPRAVQRGSAYISRYGGLGPTYAQRCLATVPIGPIRSTLGLRQFAVLASRNQPVLSRISELDQHPETLKDRLAKRERTRQAREARKPVRATRQSNLMRDAMDRQISGLEKISTDLGRSVVLRNSSTRPTRRIFDAPRSLKVAPAGPVTMSIFLYAPPAWEMDSIHPATTSKLHPSLISELHSLATLHRDHLTAVANILKKLYQHGATDLRVVEADESGTYELVLTFPRGWARNDVVDAFLVMGIDPCSPHFKLEQQKLQPETRAPSVPLDYSTASASFPWLSDSPSYEFYPQSPVAQDAYEFLAMVDSELSDGRRFGSKTNIK